MGIEMNVQEKLVLAEKNLEILVEWVGRFDNKIPIILGINSGMLGMLVTFAPPLINWTPGLLLLTLLSVLGIGVSFVFFYFSSYPRTKGPKESLYYFGSIAKKSNLEYQQAFLKRNAEEHLIDILGQCHRNSEIITDKFWCLKGVYISLFLSLFFSAITIYFFRSLTLAS